MSDQATEEASSWLEQPEVYAAFEVVLGELMVESDRGATVIAADMISNHLDDTFKRLAPPFLSSRVKEMLAYPGVASSLSGKLDIAATCGWIAENTYKASSALRKIRNKAAHSDKSFNLKDYGDLINAMLSLGEAIPAAIHNMAVEILVRNLFDKLQTGGESLVKDLGYNPFATVQQIAEELRKRPDWAAPLEERLPRLKLGLGVCMIIWLMTVQRDNLEDERAKRTATPGSPSTELPLDQLQ